MYLRGSEEPHDRPEMDPMKNFLRLAFEKHTQPIIFVPLLVVYSKFSQKESRRGFKEIIEGDFENPSSLRRFMAFLRNYRNIMVRVCEPLDLFKFIESQVYDDHDLLAFMLRRELIDRIDTEKKVIVGPVLKSRQEIITTTLMDSGLKATMEKMEERSGEDFEKVRRKAKDYLEEIAADYDPTYIKIWDTILTWILNNIYDGIIIDKEGLSKVREVSKKAPLVIIPSHKSHMDYLILSYIFLRNHMHPPFIAAGVNLSFWPLGRFFRKSGAFFMRRHFKGNRLYGKIFSTYVKILIKEGYSLEFFIEGGRSRTGKLVLPKYGLISLLLQAYDEGMCSDLFFVPVSIAYERVIEEKSYIKELEGNSKEREGLVSLIKSRKLLKKRYGKVYINFDNPISLKEHINCSISNYDNKKRGEKKIICTKMAYRIVQSINKMTMVTPFSLVACALLSSYRRGISYRNL
ncbi:MAG: 1-acyl-sn-glycerol-3-phosphate acyltransferase, partial [Thermodesulfobacteriota bacterium]|nr:1-acyl-sn-glycerol-3-phosphate acyltransferase [Thermodesulfobacteriota bacterium]